MAVVKLSDVIVPEIFSPYTQQKTKELTTLISAGVLVPDEELNTKLKGGGQTFNAPSWNDLDNDEENVGSDDESPSTPQKIGTVLEVAARMERNNSWSAMSLAGVLAGSDPMQAIGSRIGHYWARRLQATFLNVAQGIFAENDKSSPNGKGTQYDLTYDISGQVGEEARFSAAAMLGAFLKMGDAQEALGVIFVHSVVMNRMQTLNLIDYVLDSATNTNIPYYMGRRVIMNDAMPNNQGKFETWVFGAGAFRFGEIQPENATEVERKASSGNGAGQDILHSRVTWCIHPEGYAIIPGSSSNGGDWKAGGPANANLKHADSWKRAFTERKQIRMVRLITKEFEVRGDS